MILIPLGQTQWLTSQAGLLTAPFGPPQVAAFSVSRGNLLLCALRPEEGGERLRADWLQHLSWPLEAAVLASFCESHSWADTLTETKCNIVALTILLLVLSPTGFLRYNLHIMLCKFKVYNVMIRCTNILCFSALHSHYRFFWVFLQIESKTFHQQKDCDLLKVQMMVFINKIFFSNKIFLIKECRLPILDILLHT